MKKVFTLAAALALFATTQAFAIIGAGAHYVMNTGSLKGSNEFFVVGNSQLSKEIHVEQKAASGLQGIGFKGWIDFLPFVDIEGTFNVAAVRYETILKVDGIEVPLSYVPDAPYNMVFDKASPLFGVVNGDLSVTYPFDVPLVRPYVGAGVSYFASIPIVNKDFVKKVVDDAPGVLDALDPNNIDPNDPNIAGNVAGAVGDAVVKSLKNLDYKTGIGGHVIGGFRIKAPILPAAIYVNGKYYFGGNTNSQFTQGVVIEVGGGLAI